MSDSPTRTLTMKEFDPSEQPREKAERYGCGILSIPELLAIILRIGVPGMPIIDMTRHLLSTSGGSLHTLARRTRREIMMTPGMGLQKTIQIEAVLELMKRYLREEETYSPTIIKSSKDIYNYMRPDIANAPQEQIWLITLSRRNSIIARYHLTTGSSVASIFDLKRSLKIAILDDSASVVLVHNHPSGNTRPSVQDDAITKSLRNACATMDIRLLDHLIITTEGFYSYADEGKLG